MCVFFDCLEQRIKRGRTVMWLCEWLRTSLYRAELLEYQYIETEENVEKPGFTKWISSETFFVTWTIPQYFNVFDEDESIKINCWRCGNPIQSSFIISITSQCQTILILFSTLPFTTNIVNVSLNGIHSKYHFL